MSRQPATQPQRPKRWPGLLLALAVISSSLPAMATQAHPLAPTTADRVLARALYLDLLRIPTVKGNGKVPELADHLTARLQAAGFDSADIARLPVQTEGDTTLGLLVRYRGASGNTHKPIALLAHMDVVDAVAANWSTDPFVPVEKDGYLYARGSMDTKASVALLVTTFIRLKRAGWVPDRDVVLALSGDEESGSRTTQLLAAHAWIQNAEYALNADGGTGALGKDGAPPAFFFQAAEKTSVSFKLETRNRGGHSSAPRADNALYDMADALQAIRALRFPVQFNEVNRAMAQALVASRGGALAQALQTLMAQPDNAAARAVVERYPEDAHILWTTCVPTMIQGGNARNALPQNVSTTVHCRIFPGVSTESVQAALTQAVAASGATVTVDAARGSSPPSPIRADLFAAVRKAVHANYPSATLTPEMSSGGTDGRYFRAAGIPTYGVGSLALQHPEDDRAHGVDERMRLQSFDDELLFWDVLLKALAGNASAHH